MGKAGQLEAKYVLNILQRFVCLFLPLPTNLMLSPKDENRDENTRLEVKISGFDCEFIIY